MSTLDEQYKKCKMQIKLWERDFKKRKNRPPSKGDIKEAPTVVKEAYKQYWLTKTSILEEVILDYDSKCKTSPGVGNNDGENSPVNGPSKTTPSETANKNTIWGDHVKKAVEKSNEIKLRKSSSLVFTEKLFKSIELKKRNLRKSGFSVNKLRNIDSMNVESLSQTSDAELKVQVSNKSLKIVPESILNETSDESKNAYSPVKVASLTVHSPDEDENYPVSFNNIRITKGKSVLSVQPVNILHTANQSTHFCSVFKNQLDGGWLQRCDKFCNIDSSSKTTEKTDNLRPKPIVNLFKRDNSYQNFLVSNDISNSALSSDDDYVFSDTEEKFDMLLARPTFLDNSKCSENINSPEISNTLSKVMRPENEESEQRSATFRSKKFNTEPVGYIISGSGKEKRVGDKLENETKRAKINDEAQKFDRLRKKIVDGTINDNFVRIDLKHKRYARGKKVISSSKYKIQQWKMKKRIANAVNSGTESSNAVVKCFRCGDVGHLMRKCKKNVLAPLDDDLEEDESQFPTLAEAAEMAKAKMANKNDVEEILDVCVEIEEPETDDNEFVGVVKPLYECEADDSVKATSDEVLKTLREFGYKSFRPGQETAIMRILSGKSTIVISGTGSGKSLCYQIPAYIYAKRYKCISLVISPLVSLMEDQVLNFPSCLKAACLHTNQTASARKKVMKKIETNEISVLLISPETMVSGERGILGSTLMKSFPSIAFVCIDEVHCLSQWSYNFRTSYLIICKILRERFKINVFLGLTATASKSTISCITKHLGILDENTGGVLKEKILPDNLLLSTSKDEHRDNALLSILKRSPFSEFESIIIYCLRRNECDRLASYLRTSLQNFREQTYKHGNRSRVSEDVEVYHAGLSATRRKKIQSNFMKGHLRIVVATAAFGMGINKADIRGIIHYNMPRTFEHYVQEIGRAGRDGLVARCHLFCSTQGADLPDLRRYIYSDSVDRPTIRKLLSRVFPRCNCNGPCLKHELAFSVDKTVTELDIPQENISTLLCYLEVLSENLVETLPLTYTMCIVTSYNGVLALKRAAKKCPPLAFAIAEQCRKTNSKTISTKLEFSVIELADKIGWESGTVKRELKRCEWTFVDEKWKKTGVGINFSELGFHMRSPGNLTEEQLDAALDTLSNRIAAQENTALYQLDMCNQTFQSLAYSTVDDVMEAEDLLERDNCLKNLISRYFEEENELCQINMVEAKLNDEQFVITNIHRIVSSNPDIAFTGRAIARIFHGIESPNYPALAWFRTPFWRCALREDFNAVYRLASRELLKFR